MKFSQKWCVIVVLLFAFSATVSSLAAQTEEPSAVNAPSSTEVQSSSDMATANVELDSVEVLSSSDKLKQKQPALAPNRDTAAANVEIERRFNELRRELLDDREKTIDDRAEMIDRWLATTAVFLTFLAIIIPIIVLIGGRFSFKKFNEIKDEAQRHVKEIQAHRDEADSLVKGMNAATAGADPDKASDVVENVQQNPASSLIERVVAAALSLQQQNRIEEAIEKWRSIANIAEKTDDDRAAEAWFSVGYLSSPKNKKGEDFKGAIAAYNKAIDLNLSGPNLYWAYYNRGNAKDSDGQIEGARADYNEALDLARAVGNTDLMTRAEHALEILDRRDAS